MNITGKIIKIGETISSNGFEKRDVVVKTSEQYPQLLTIQFVQDKCRNFDNNKYEINQEVTIGINLKGREWTSPQGEVKYFNTIEGWNIKAGVIGTSKLPIQTEKTDLPF